MHLKSEHLLLLQVEYCTARRPTATLRGSSEKYAQEFATVEEIAQDEVAMGEGELRVISNDRGGMQHALSEPSKAGDERPQSAPHRRAPTLPPRPPRIGSFEVACALRNRRTGMIYGPVELFSKLQSGNWPSRDKMSERLHVHMQRWLMTDERA